MKQKKNKCHKLYLATIFLLSSGVINAQTAQQHSNTPPQTSNLFFDQLEFGFSVNTQAHRSQFDWSIAADMSGEKNPNTLSELEYDALELQVLETRFSTTYPLNPDIDFTFNLGLSSGHIDSGQVIDSDYSGNNKTNPRSISYSDPNGSSIEYQDISFEISNTLSQKTKVGLLLGFSKQTQTFVKRNGLQVFSARNSSAPEVGTTLTNLNSSYQAEWDSQFLGFKLKQAIGKHALSLNFNYHFSDYYASANWNLRKTFQHPKSFEHLANGTGLSSEINYMIPLFDHWHLNLSAYHEKWQTEEGVDRVFLIDGSTPTTKLNQAQWESFGYGLGLNYYTNF